MFIFSDEFINDFCDELGVTRADFITMGELIVAGVKDCWVINTDFYVHLSLATTAVRDIGVIYAIDDPDAFKEHSLISSFKAITICSCYKILQNPMLNKNTVLYHVINPQYHPPVMSEAIQEEMDEIELIVDTVHELTS